MSVHNVIIFSFTAPHNRASGGTTRIAFFATVKTTIEHTTAYQTIVFEDVKTNFGNGYNATSGIFTAPTDGVYVFSTTILTCPGCVASVGLIKNSHSVSGLYAEGATDKRPTTAETILLELTRGDQMSVKIAEAKDQVVGNHYTTFAGFLLWETAPQTDQPFTSAPQQAMVGK